MIVVLRACGVLAVLLGAIAPALAEEKVFTLADGGASEETVARVVTVSGGGEFVFQSSAADGEPTRHPVTVNASYKFLERRLPGVGPNAAAFRAFRRYVEAASRIQVADQTVARSPRANRRNIVVWLTRQGIDVYSTDGSLTAKEIELLPSPGDHLMLAALLPDESVQIGESWEPDGWTVAMLAGLDVAFEKSISCQLESVKDEIAKVTLTGTVEGGLKGAKVSATISGEFGFDLESKRIVSATIVHEENREVGPLSPGMEVTLTAKLQSRPAAETNAISDAEIAGAAELPTAEELAVEHLFPQSVALVSDRRWQLFHRFDERMILRLLDDGGVVAQCNVLLGETVEAGTRTPAREFQQGIRKSLGDALDEIVSAEEVVGIDNLKVYRVRAVGGGADRPREWRYYLVTAADGRQVSFVFTIEPDNAAALGQRDLALVKGVRFRESGIGGRESGVGRGE